MPTPTKAILLGLLATPLMAQERGGIAVTHVTVIDLAEGRLLPDRTVTVRGDRIVSVAPSTSVKPAPDTRAIDATGKFLIPGLWDMHVHVFAFERSDLRHFVRHGVTGVRDLGGLPDSISALVRDIGAGTLVGPRIVWAGRTLDLGGAPTIAAARTDAEARAAVQANAAAGARVIKVWSTIPHDGFLGAAGEARRLGLPLVGHIPVSMDLVPAVEAGQRDIEHTIGYPIAFSREGVAILTRLRAQVNLAPHPGAIFSALIAADVAALAVPDEGRASQALQLMARDTVWACPTLTDSRAYTVVRDSLADDTRFRNFPASLKERWLADMNGMSEADFAGLKELFPAALRLVGRMHRAGVPLLAGTDAGSLYDFPGFDLHNELALMVRAGLSPLEALRTATTNPARALGMADRIGAIAPGMLADLVLLDANPLLEVRNTTRIAGVIAAGRYLDGRTE